MELQELAKTIGASTEATTQLLETYGLSADTITPQEVNTLKSANQPGQLSQKTKRTLVKTDVKPLKNAPVVCQIEAPKFAPQSPIDQGLEQVKANAQAVGYTDIARLMAAQQQGYAEGAELAWEEGVQQFSTFRNSIYSGIASAMLS